jgi:hypothetical protein
LTLSLFFLSLAGSLFLGAALLILYSALLRFLAEPRFFDFALTLLNVFPPARLQKSAGARIHLACRKLPEHFVRTLISRRLIGSRFLEGARFRLLRRGLLLLRLLGRTRGNRALPLGLDKNGFRAPVAEVLPDVALFHCPLHIQRHCLAAARRFMVRFFRFAHSLSWRSEAISASPAQ